MRSTFEHVLLQHKVLPPYVDDVVGQGAARGAVIVETGNTAIDVKGGCVEEPPLRIVSMTPTTQGGMDAAHPHETLERRAVKRLAVLGSHGASHNGVLFPLGDLVSVVCGGGGEALGGINRTRWGSKKGFTKRSEAIGPRQTEKLAHARGVLLR